MEDDMRAIAAMASLLAIFCAVPPASGGDFDGSRPLLVSFARVLECTSMGGCREVSFEEVNLPPFLKVDFAQNTIRPARGGEEIPDSAIERSERVDGKLILQGAEDGYADLRDGLGWSLAVSEETGRVVLTASGDGVAFVAFGHSLPQ
jgi:hypothetical protein